MHSQPAQGHASDGWNQHNNNKSTECTHSVVYMYECGGGGSGEGGEWGGGGHLLTFFFSSFFFDVGSHHPLSRNCSEIFLYFFFLQYFPNNGHNTREKLFVGTTAKQTFMSPCPVTPTCNNILPCPHFTYCTERSLCKLLSISSATSLTKAVVRFRMSLTKMVRSLHVAIILAQLCDRE